jgi:hypothetical protein
MLICQPPVSNTFPLQKIENRLGPERLQTAPLTPRYAGKTRLNPPAPPVITANLVLPRKHGGTSTEQAAESSDLD